MLGAAYAAVPLYELFCKVTGYRRHAAHRHRNHRSRRASASSRFASTPTCSRACGWRFEPEQASIQARVGETQTVFYKITECRPRGR